MKFVVTGGAGFIGSHLSEALLEEGHEVTVIDTFCSSREENVSAFQGEPRFTLVEQDILEPVDIQDADYVLHLASRASPKDYQEFPVHTLRTNTEGTLNMLELAERNDASFLFASTSEVYGNPKVHPQREDYWGHVNPVGPRACYDEGKRAGEAMITSFAQKHEVDYRIVRIFNTYGPRMREDDGRVISNFMTQAIAGEPITVYGDGSQTRSFCYVNDLVDGLVELLQSDSGEIFNLGNPEEVEIQELAHAVKELTDSESEIVHRDLPQDDPERRCPDISKVKERTGWEPRVGLEEGLERTLAYFQEVAGG